MPEPFEDVVADQAGPGMVVQGDPVTPGRGPIEKIAIVDIATGNGDVGRSVDANMAADAFITFHSLNTAIGSIRKADVRPCFGSTVGPVDLHAFNGHLCNTNHRLDFGKKQGIERNPLLTESTKPSKPRLMSKVNV